MTASLESRTKYNACPSRSLKSRRLGSPLWRFFNLPLINSTLSKFPVPTHAIVKEGVLFSLSSHLLLILVATPSGFQSLMTLWVRAGVGPALHWSSSGGWAKPWEKLSQRAIYPSQVPWLFMFIYLLSGSTENIMPQ